MNENNFLSLKNAIKIARTLMKENKIPKQTIKEIKEKLKKFEI